MKKSLMSISMLVVSISMVAMLVCSCAASAQTTSPKFAYDKKENVETVYTFDETGKYLTPKLKYELSKNESGRVKTAYRWNAVSSTWMPAYQLKVSETLNASTVEYAEWSNKSKDFSGNPQKAVYSKDVNNEILSYVLYKWDASEKNWMVAQNLLLEDYLAEAVNSVK